MTPNTQEAQPAAAGPGFPIESSLGGGFGNLHKLKSSSGKEPAALRQAFPIPTCDLAADDPNATTILRANERLTKLVLLNRRAVIPFNERIKYYAATVVDVSTPELLRALLPILIERWGCANIAGAILPSANRERLRRLKIEKADEPDGQQTFIDVPRYVHVLDVDKLKASADFDLHDIEAAAALARKALPPAFHNVRCIGMATSSYLLDPLKRELRFRLFFRFSRPISSAGLKRWLKDRERSSVVDFAPMHAVGINYTARPIFEQPADDPLPGGRIVELPGEECVTPPSVEALQPPPPRLRRPAPAIAIGNSVAALLACEILIERAEKGDRHNVIMQQCFNMASYIDAGMVTLDEGLETIVAAAERVGKDRDETERIFFWVLDKKQEERDQREAVEAKVRMQMRSDEEDS